jgi:hypothetical protein
MSAQTHSPDTGVTPSPDSGGVTPTQTPTDTGVTPSQSSSLSPASETRDADATGNLDESREAALDRAELQKALKAERHRSREMERALKALQDAEKTRTDAEKSEIERATERAETAERRVASMEREMLARQVANETGIPGLWHRLSGDDTRALRADAQRLREEMGLTSGALEGGVRSDGVPAQPSSMDELIRGFGEGRR